MSSIPLFILSPSLPVSCCVQSSSISSLRRAVRRSPRDGRAWQALAKKITSAQGLAAGQTTLREALRRNPRNPYLWQSLAVAHLKAGDRDEARDACEKALSVDRNHSSAWATLARVHEAENDVQGAREVYRRGASFDGSGKLLHAWAVMEIRNGNVGRGMEILEELGGDGGAYGWCTMGGVWRKRGNLIKARECYQRALEQQDRAAWVVWAELGKLEMAEGRWEDARRCFIQGGAGGKGDAKFWGQWAKMEMKTGDMQEAKRLVQVALRKDDRDSRLWCLWARVEKALGQFDTARELFKKACKVGKREWVCWDMWSEMEHELGNADEAQRLVEESFRVRFGAEGAFSVLANNIDDGPRGDRLRAHTS